MRHFTTLVLFLFLVRLSAQSLEFTAPPVMIAATTNSMTLKWKTNTTQTEGVVLWGLSPNDLTQSQAILGASNQIQLNNLLPATVYYCQIELTLENQTITTPAKPFITSANSSGEMKVYFNFPVDASYSNGATPETTTAIGLEDQMIQYILSATKTLDICMYNVNRSGYISALKQIAANGVRVRYIAESSQSNFSLNTTLNFALHYAETNGIMHNKWLIIDKEDTDKALVVTGAYNFTKSNLFDGYNNMISIQDQALAEIYTMEFEEMWGGAYDQPNTTLSRFGNKKEDNTPHQLFINGVLVESYFSPSDNTTQHIVDALNTTDEDLKFSLLVFTNDNMEDAIFDMTTPVKGLIESQYNGTATVQFQAAGIPIYDYDEAGRFIHHKYALIDSDTESDPTIVTGSHNWSYSAEYKNDENTLIIHDADIVNIYLQEFMARWKTVVAIEDIMGQTQISVQPNPASDLLLIQNNRTDEQTVSLIDCYGRQLKKWDLRSNEQRTINVQHFPQGIYQLLITSHKTGLVANETILIMH